jgi:Sulfotransferase family
VPFNEDFERTLRKTARRSLILRRMHQRLVNKRQEILMIAARWRAIAARERNSSERSNGVNPENMIWIFGSGRSGSTWLRSMMEEMSGYGVWEEPMVGMLFGEFYDKTQAGNVRSADFIMGDPVRKGWIRSIRNFILDGAGYSKPGLTAEEYLVIKEPNGSIGAPLLMEALPESRMILLLRDPRDVVASVLDAAREGGWLYEGRDKGMAKRKRLADHKPNKFVRRRIKVYLKGISSARRAYEAHEGPKVLIRYEDLRSDTLTTMKSVYSTLGLPVDEIELVRGVKKHSWENIPQSEKGRGKFYRKAAPGGWKKDLTPRQVALIEEMAAPILEEFYLG